MNETVVPVSLDSAMHMPQWTRISHIDRANYPKPFLKDRLQPLPKVMNEITEDNLSIADNARIIHLEKSIQFLKNQHREMLNSLQEEVERLCIENKSLTSQLLMGNNSLHGLSNGSSPNISNDNPQKVITDLRKELNDAIDRNHMLQHLVEQQAKDIISQKELKIAQNNLTNDASPDESNINNLPTELQLGKIRLLVNPLMIYSQNNPEPHRPTLEEAENVIRHLCHTNYHQETEIVKLRADLREVLYSGKWRPNTLPINAQHVYNNDDTFSASTNATSLPSTGLIQGQRMLHLHSGKNLFDVKRKLPLLPDISPDGIFGTATVPSLRPLHQALPGNKAAERRKRTQILQRARLQTEQ